MPLTDDVIATARAVTDALQQHLDDDGRFQPFAGRITPDWLRLIQARRDFRHSGAEGTGTLLSSAEMARVSAVAMQPDRASVDACLSHVMRLSTDLEQASGGRSAPSRSAPAGYQTGAREYSGSEWLRGALRIVRTPASAEASARYRDGPPGPTRPTGTADANYYQKLTNLFPAEALALYGTGVALFGGATPFVVLAVFGVLLALRIFATQPPKGGAPQWVAVLVAAVSFLLWATATDPAWLVWATHPTEDLRRGAAFLGAALVILAPVLVRPQA